MGDQQVLQSPGAWKSGWVEPSEFWMFFQDFLKQENVRLPGMHTSSYPVIRNLCSHPEAEAKNHAQLSQESKTNLCRSKTNMGNQNTNFLRQLRIPNKDEYAAQREREERARRPVSARERPKSIDLLASSDDESENNNDGQNEETAHREEIVQTPKMPETPIRILLFGSKFRRCQLVAC